MLDVWVIVSAVEINISVNPAIIFFITFSPHSFDARCHKTDANLIPDQKYD